MDDPLRPLVSLSDSADIAAALPYLVGFHPHESLVLVSLGGPTGTRVGLTVRAALPARSASAAVVTALVRSVATDDPAGVVVAVVSEAPDERGALPGGDALDGLPHREAGAGAGGVAAVGGGVARGAGGARGNPDGAARRSWDTMLRAVPHCRP